MIPSRETRAKVWHVLFLAFFSLFALALLAWLTVGLGPGVTRASSSLHDTLHEWGGGDAGVVEVRAERLSFSTERLTLPLRGVTIRFTNADPGVAHNVSIYRVRPLSAGDESAPLFRGKIVTGPATREYTVFDVPRPGTYYFRCDVFPGMEGTVTVSEGAPAGEGPGGWRAVVRRVANASHESQHPGIVLLEYVVSAAFLALGVFLIRRRSRDRTARLLALGMIGTGAVFNLQAHTIFGVTGRPATIDTLHALFHLLAGVAFVYAVLLFPDGKLIPRWRTWWLRWPLRGAYALATFMVIGLSIEGADVFHPSFFVAFFGILIPIVGVAAQGYRYLHASTPGERQQSRLLMRALAPAFAVGVLFAVLNLTRWSDLSGARLENAQALTFHVFQPVFVIIPVALFIGILRYRLLDIEVVVNKAVLFGALAAFIAAVYVALVVGIGRAIGPRGETAFSIAALVIVAFAFEPVRERLRRIANRLVYGERATPYEVMADFSERLAGALSVEEVLPRMAEAAARGVGAVRGRVRLFLPEGGERSASWPPGGAEEAFDRTIPVSHQGQPVGEIAIGKPPGDPITAVEEKLLSALGSQAEFALHNVRLTLELQARLEKVSSQARELAASRRRILTAETAERRRLEREVHEGVEGHLLSIAETLDAAEKAIGRAPKKAVGLLDAVGERTNEALETLRDLARGIFPPLLVDHGVLPSLEAQIRKLRVPAEVRAASGLAERRFDPHAEAAVYFCCVEALKNAAKHAAGSPITVQLAARDGWVEFSVSDAGPGFDAQAVRSAPDLQNMADRVQALGGALEVHSAPGQGTTVAGRVPVSPRLPQPTPRRGVPGRTPTSGYTPPPRTRRRATRTPRPRRSRPGTRRGRSS